MSDYSKQKINKPAIEQLIDENLNGINKENATNIVKYFRTNNMSPQWGSTNSFNVSFKNRRVSIIKINKNKLEVWINTQYNEDLNNLCSDSSDEFKRFLKETIIYCFGCGSCKPGLNITILGDEFNGVCCNPVIRMINPNETLLDFIVKLVMLRQKAVKEGKVPNVTYIAKHKR